MGKTIFQKQDTKTETICGLQFQPQ